MQIDRDRLLNPLDENPELEIDEYGIGLDTWIHEDRRSWSLNWPLLIGTVVVSLVCVAIGSYRYKRQVERLGPHLLKLANQAEEEDDWRLVRTRLRRYLSVNRADVESTRRLADLYFTQGESYEDARSGMLLYASVLSKYSKDDERYAELQLRYLTLLSLTNPAEGLVELDALLPPGAGLERVLRQQPDLIEALRLRIEVLELQLPKKLLKEKDALRERLIDDYELLARIQPYKPESAQRLALIYRQHADALQATDFKRAQQLKQLADKTMDEAVAAHPTDIDALLRRFQYRLRYAESRYPDTSDLQRILELDDSNPLALLNLAIYLAHPRGDPNKTSRSALRASRDFLIRSIDGLPKEPVVAVALANIHIQLQEEEAAEEVLQRASKDFPDSNLVYVAQTKLALAQRRFDEAAAAIERIRQAARQKQLIAWSSPEDVGTAKVQQAEADVLEAELILESGGGEADQEKASALLHNLDFSRLQSRDRVDVLQDAGRLFARLQDWKNAIDALERARSSGLVRTKSDLLLAQCYERVNQDDRAVNVYEEMAPRRLSAPEAKAVWFGLGMAELRYQLGRSGRERWDKVQAASDKLSSLAPASEEAFLLRMYLELKRGITDRSAAVAELKAAEPRFNLSVRYWVLCVEVYRKLEEFRLLQDAMERLAATGGELPDSVASAVSRPILKTEMSEDELKRFQQISGDWDGTSVEARLESIRRWCEDSPNSISAHLTLANLGSTLNRPDIIDEAVKSLQEIEAGSGYFWRIAEVSMHLTLFRNGSQPDGNEARRKAEELAAQYPGQVEVSHLAAVCQETCGDLKAASEHYLRALKTEPTNWAIDGRLRTLVYQKNWEQVGRLVEQLPPESWLTPERLDFVVHVLCEEREFTEALGAIEQAAEQEKLAAAHTHYLSAVVRMKEPSRENAISAHQDLLRAAAKAPDNLNYWVALFHFEINHQPELWTADACKTANRIRWLLQAHGREFAPEWTSLILAQTLQLRGRLAEADAFFRKTVAMEPGTASLGWIPNSILSKDATATDSPVTPEVAWLAGEQYARTLAAMQTIWHGQQQTGLEIPAEDSRLRAILDVTNGKEEDAIKTLLSQVTQQRGPGDLLLLAALQDRTEDKQAARQYRLDCITEPNVPAYAIQQVLDHALSTDDFELARQCVQLFTDQNVSPLNRQLIEARIELGTSEWPEDIESWVRQRQQDLTDERDQQSFLLTMVDILAEHEHLAPAAELLNEVVANRSDRSQAVGLWLASQPSLLDSAMRQFSKVEKDEPPSVLVQMLYRLTQYLPAESPHRKRLMKVSTSLLDQAPELSPIEWLALGTAFERLGLPEMAVRACEMALPEDGSPSMAEHHLVWLNGGYLRNLPAPQEELDRLVRQFGPREDLMDTRAIFLLLDGQSVDAADITRRLTLHEPLNVTYRLHDSLAVASLLPLDQRGEVLAEITDEQRQQATVLARQILQQLLESETEFAP